MSFFYSAEKICTPVIKANQVSKPVLSMLIWCNSRIKTWYRFETYKHTREMSGWDGKIDVEPKIMFLNHSIIKFARARWNKFLITCT